MVKTIKQWVEAKRARKHVRELNNILDQTEMTLELLRTERTDIVVNAMKDRLNILRDIFSKPPLEPEPGLKEMTKEELAEFIKLVKS